MKPFAAPVPGIVFTIFGAPAGTAPVVNEKVALMHVVAAECATMRNAYGFPPFMPSSSVRWVGSARSTGADIVGGAPATMSAPVDLADPTHRTLLLGMKGGKPYAFRIVAH